MTTVSPAKLLLEILNNNMFNQAMKFPNCVHQCTLPSSNFFSFEEQKTQGHMQCSKICTCCDLSLRHLLNDFAPCLHSSVVFWTSSAKFWGHENACMTASKVAWCEIPTLATIISTWIFSCCSCHCSKKRCSMTTDWFRIQKKLLVDAHSGVLKALHTIKHIGHGGHHFVWAGLECFVLNNLLMMMILNYVVVLHGLHDRWGVISSAAARLLQRSIIIRRRMNPHQHGCITQELHNTAYGEGEESQQEVHKLFSCFHTQHLPAYFGEEQRDGYEAPGNVFCRRFRHLNRANAALRYFFSLPSCCPCFHDRKLYSSKPWQGFSWHEHPRLSTTTHKNHHRHTDIERTTSNYQLF